MIFMLILYVENITIAILQIDTHTLLQKNEYSTPLLPPQKKFIMHVKHGMQ